MLGEPDLYVVVDVECHVGGMEIVQSHLDFTAPLYSKVSIVPDYVDLSRPRHVYQV